MAVFIFQSAKDATVIGFTEDRAGGNLPRELAPWRPIGGQALPPDRQDAIRTALQTEGYYIAHGSSLANPPVTH